MATKDYYATLGCSKSASAEELKKAYRKKAIELHPDRNPGDSNAEAKFKELNEAYSVLSDSKKRQTYDQFGSEGLKGAAGNGFGGFGGFSGGGQFNFGDIFEEAFSGESVFDSFFGQGGRRSGNTRGADLKYEYTITLEESYHGKQVELKLEKKNQCRVCDGSGSTDGSVATCDTCGGAGQIRQSRGMFSINSTCPSCRGEGKTISDPCKNCRGQGVVFGVKNLSVQIPAGIDDGQSMRVSGEGEAGPRGGAAGDLYIVISLKKHALFSRDGAELHCVLQVDLLQSVLGDSVELKNIDGEKVRLKIAAGTQPGATMRLRGKGMPKLNKREYGDLFVRVDVSIPTKLSMKEKEMFEQLRELMPSSSVVKQQKKSKRSFFSF